MDLFTLNIFGRLYQSVIYPERSRRTPAFFVIAKDVKHSVEHFQQSQSQKELRSSWGALLRVEGFVNVFTNKVLCKFGTEILSDKFK